MSHNLRDLLQEAVVLSARLPVSVVGYEFSGKTELVENWKRAFLKRYPSLGANENAPAMPDDQRDKTSGMNMSCDYRQFSISFEIECAGMFTFNARALHLRDQVILRNPFAVLI